MAFTFSWDILLDFWCSMAFWASLRMFNLLVGLCELLAKLTALAPQTLAEFMSPVFKDFNSADDISESDSMRKVGCKILE